MDTREAKTFYRTAGLFYAIYALTLGIRHRDILLIGTSVILFLVDAWLLGTGEFDVSILQPLRLAATLMLGPLWILKAAQYQNIPLGVMGLSFIVFDGALYLHEYSLKWR